MKISASKPFGISLLQGIPENIVTSAQQFVLHQPETLGGHYHVGLVMVARATLQSNVHEWNGHLRGETVL